MTKLTYHWEKVVDVFYVKVFFNEHDYAGVLTFNDEDAFYLFMETAMAGQQGMHNEAPILVEYTKPDKDAFETGKVEAIYETNARSDDRE